MGRLRDKNRWWYETVEEVDQALALWLRTEPDLSSWTTRGMDARVAFTWTAAGIDDPVQVDAWYAAIQYTLDDLDEIGSDDWYSPIACMADLASELDDAGLEPSDVDGWDPRRIDADLIIDWTCEGFTPGQATSWLNHGKVEDPRVATVWARWGWTPSDASRFEDELARAMRSATGPVPHEDGSDDNESAPHRRPPQHLSGSYMSANPGPVPCA